MKQPITLVISTGNLKKLKEIKALLEDLPITVKTKQEAGLQDLEIQETGKTFYENSLLKAKGLSEKTGTWTLADDSGLEVDALDGAPGIYSSRYGGEEGNDEKNNEKLLEELKNIPADRRTANFRSVIVTCLPDGRILSSEGTVQGTIGFERRGENGFGYDPLFILPGGKTMAEISSEEKNRISHRGKALKTMKRLIEEILNEESKERT